MVTVIQQGRPGRSAWRRLMPALAVAGLLAGTGCTSTPKRDAAYTYTQEEMGAYLETASDPRRYGLTVYQSEAGPVIQFANRLHPEQVAELPWVATKSGAPLVKVGARKDIEYVALLDTASARNWSDLDTAVELPVIPLGPPAVYMEAAHVADPAAKGLLGMATKLRFDNLHAENTLFYVRMPRGTLGPVARDVADPLPRMVFGGDLLSQFSYIQFDFEKRKVVLSSTLPYRPVSEQIVAASRFRLDDGIYMLDGMVDKRHTPIILDVAGDFALAMPTPPRPIAGQVIFGDLVFRQVPVTELAAGPGLLPFPRVGRKLLARYKVTIDNTGGAVIFERP